MIKTLSELVSELSAEERIEIIRILNAQLEAAENIHFENDYIRNKKIIRDEVLKQNGGNI